jgi:hypothetical protein
LCNETKRNKAKEGSTWTSKIDSRKCYSIWQNIN